MSLLQYAVPRWKFFFTYRQNQSRKYIVSQYTRKILSSDRTDHRIGFRVFFRKEMNSRSKNSFSCNNNRTDRRRNTMINFAIFAIMMPLNLLFLVIDWIVLNF